MMTTAVSVVVLVGATLAVFLATSTAEENCTVKLVADIYILTDGSNSINNIGWQRSLTFVSNLTNSFLIGPEHVQFAFGTFSTRFVHIFDLNKYTNQDDVSKAVFNTTHLKGITYTFDALRAIRVDGYLNSTSKGSRTGVPKILIVVTDGNSDNITRTIAEADALRKLGVRIMVISVGGVNQVECIGIAGTEKNVFSVNNFAGLDAIKSQITQRVCEDIVPEPDPCPGTVAIDLVFVIDSSGSIGDENYKKNFEFVVKSIRGFTLGPKATRVALVTFASSPRVIFPLTDDINFIYEKLMNVPYQNTTTRTHLALNRAAELLKVEKGGRNEAKKIVLLVTDGLSTQPNETLVAASTLRASQILVITVGVKPHANEIELKAVASKPEYFFLSSNYSVLVSFANPVSAVACKEPIPPPTVPIPPPTQPIPPPTVPIPPPTAPVPEPEPCPGTVAVDLVFVIDSSGSIGDENYKKNFDFVVKSIRGFTLGLKATRVAMVTFGSSPQVIFSLTDNSSLIDEKLINVPYQNTKTRTHLALIKAQELLKVENGGRNEAKKIIVVVTDGLSTEPNETLVAASNLRASQILVITVGVKPHANETELKAVASKPEYSFLVFNYSVLVSFANPVSAVACKEPIPPPTVKPCPAATIVDMYFLVDSSGSITNESYHYNFEFIQSITDVYYIAEDGAKVAMLTFGTYVIPTFKLSGNRTFIREHLKNVPYQGSTTNTHLALNYLLDNGWNTPQNGARNGSHVVILITDGQSTEANETLKAASRVKAAGFTIITIGVGDYVDKIELTDVSSKPEYVISAKDYSVLGNFASKTSDIACKDSQSGGT